MKGAALGALTLWTRRLCGQNARPLPESFTVVDGGGSNVLTFSSSDGFVLVDSGATKSGDQVTAAIRDFGGEQQSLTFNPTIQTAGTSSLTFGGQTTAAINANAETYRRALLITDGVFSMDGDIAPLPELYEVAKKYGLMFMVDDAHGEGVLGRGGRGIVDHFGLHGKVDIEVGTLSKAFGVVGGLVAGDKVIVEWLRQRGRPFLFSSAMTAMDVGACIAAIDLLESSTELVDRLWDNARYFKAEMKKLGFDTGTSETPITPVMLGDAPMAQQFSRELFDLDVFAMAIGYPTVAKGKARIRVMISAAHDRDDLGQGLEAFAKVGKKLGVIK